MNTRIQKIVDAVKKNGHDGIVISKGSDIKYLTGLPENMELQFCF